MHRLSLCWVHSFPRLIRDGNFDGSTTDETLWSDHSHRRKTTTPVPVGARPLSARERLRELLPALHHPLDCRRASTSDNATLGATTVDPISMIEGLRMNLLQLPAAPMVRRDDDSKRAYSSLAARIECPYLFNYDFNHRLIAAERMLGRMSARPTIQVAVAEGIDYTGDAVVTLDESLRDNGQADADTHSWDDLSDVQHFVTPADSRPKATVTE